MFRGSGKRVPIAAAAIAILVGAMVVSPSLGGPSFLTAKKAKKKFITKKAANNKFAAKSDVYTKSESDGRYLPNSGEIRWNVPWDGWVDEDGPGNPPTYFGNRVEFTGGDNSFFSLPVELPVALLGRSLTFTGLELCYEALPGGVVDLVNVTRVTATAADPIPGSDLIVSEDVTFTDATCRTFTPPSPVALGPNDALQVQLRLDLAAGAVDISRSTVIVRI